MAVSFGTAVPCNSGNYITSGSSYTIPLSITPTQPVVLVHSSIAGETLLGSNPIADTDNRTWSRIVAIAGVSGDPYRALEAWVGTGGNQGTSTTISVTGQSTDIFGAAIPCSGATAATGLACIDTSTSVTEPNGGTASISLSLSAAGAGEGAVFAANPLGYVAGSPAGWSVMQGIYGGEPYFEVDTLTSLASFSATWSLQNNTGAVALGFLILPGDPEDPFSAPLLEEYGF